MNLRSGLRPPLQFTLAKDPKLTKPKITNGLTFQPVQFRGPGPLNDFSSTLFSQRMGGTQKSAPLIRLTDHLEFTCGVADVDPPGPRVHTGFVTFEGADNVVLRNIAAQENNIKTADIAKREKSETISLMPTGLVGNLTLVDFASLLDYLESLAREQDKK